jgi:hypothetical protein
VVNNRAVEMRGFNIWILFCILLQNPAVDADGTVSITAAPDYILQRNCATSCFYWTIGIETFANLASALSCNLSPLENLCFCRTDLQPSAASFLTRCVSSLCGSDSVDVDSATSVYLNYCSSDGVASAAATTTASTPSTRQPAASPIPNPTASATTKSSSSGKRR